MAECYGCGKDSTRVAYRVIEGKVTSVCNQCGSPSSIVADYRDAEGNKISQSIVPQAFSYATGTPILNKKQYMNELKKQNLVQTHGRPTPNGARN